ncbi:Cystatin/monellin superfamily protein [Raphanus sativus]|nr:Cystatin/monellin superfamily protein [Raphanus sativus]
MDPNTSTEPDMSHPMDAACADPSNSPVKGKEEPLPEADHVDDEGSGEEDIEEDIEEKKDSSETDQVWGFDSFEGDDYESPDESPEDDDEREYRRYVRHYHETRGFKVDKEMIPKNLFQGLRGLNLDRYFIKPNLTGREYMEIMVKNKMLTLDHIVRVVVRMSTGVKAYITFMAKETPDGELVEYQAKTERKVWQKDIHAIFCRPASKG